jgi:putative DNA primase/helicase
MMTAADVARALAERIEALARVLLPHGRRKGHEWLIGNVHGERGSSLGVHLSGPKAGVWSDFATGESGDALDLVKAVLGADMGAALTWSRRWLGLENGAAVLPTRCPAAPNSDAPKPDPERWRYPWQTGRPIARTLAETYLCTRRLYFDDPQGRVLRFTGRRARKSPAGELEHHPALLCALSDARTGEQCGIINIYLQSDGSDRLRDGKGKTVTGRAQGGAVMLSDFDKPTAGLILCEGVETGIALFQQEIRPIWTCGAAGTLAKFPVFGGIEALTTAADADPSGQRAANELSERWREARREVFIIAPPTGDWADDQP